MLARLYKPTDAAEIDNLISNNQGHDIRLGYDEIIVTGSPINGLLVYRPGAFIHDFLCGSTAGSRLVAERLANFAVAHFNAHNLKTAIFSVDPENTKMRRFIEGIGGVEQTSKVIYTITP